MLLLNSCIVCLSLFDPLAFGCKWVAKYSSFILILTDFTRTLVNVEILLETWYELGLLSYYSANLLLILEFMVYLIFLKLLLIVGKNEMVALL